MCLMRLIQLIITFIVMRVVLLLVLNGYGVTMSDKPKSGYWYLTTTYECPVCGFSYTFKERMYGKKPDDISKRHIYGMIWCGYCLD